MVPLCHLPCGFGLMGEYPDGALFLVLSLVIDVGVLRDGLFAMPLRLTVLVADVELGEEGGLFFFFPGSSS